MSTLLEHIQNLSEEFLQTEMSWDYYREQINNVMKELESQDDRDAFVGALTIIQGFDYREADIPEHMYSTPIVSFDQNCDFEFIDTRFRIKYINPKFADLEDDDEPIVSKTGWYWYVYPTVEKTLDAQGPFPSGRKAYEDAIQKLKERNQIRLIENK